MSGNLSRSVQLGVWGGLLVVIGVIFGVYFWKLSRDGTMEPSPPVIGHVAPFQLTNQFGAAVTLDDLRGKVWLADIIFTRCPGPCERMTRSMSELQSILPATEEFRLVSLTTDPGFDSPAVLRNYGHEFGADTNRWLFLTGNPREIERLAINSLKLTAIEKEASQRTAENDLWVHSTIFVVVDRQGRLRGVFETTGPDVDWRAMKERIRSTVLQLLEED